MVASRAMSADALMRLIGADATLPGGNNSDLQFVHLDPHAGEQARPAAHGPSDTPEQKPYSLPLEWHGSRHTTYFARSSSRSNRTIGG